MEFSVKQRVEAIDRVGIWSCGEIVAIENGETVVRFDGYGSSHDRRILMSENEIVEIRAVTELSSPQETKRRRVKDCELMKVQDRIRHMERDDGVWFFCQEANAVLKGIVKTVDPIRMKVVVKSTKKGMVELTPKDFCEPPTTMAPIKKPINQCRKREQDKQHKRNHEFEQEEKSEDEHPRPRVQDTVSPHVPLLFYIRPTDGLKVQIGGIVKADSFQAPLLINEMWEENSKVHAKLRMFNVSTNSIEDDFLIQCDINFLSVWDGDKLKTKAATDALFAAASHELSTYLQCNDSADLRLFYRRLCIGRVLRDAIAAGFSNLSSCRSSLGPFDLFSDAVVFGFGTSFTRKFSLLEDGDFSFLDGLMGGKWDIKLGKDVDSFLNM